MLAPPQTYIFQAENLANTDNSGKTVVFWANFVNFGKNQEIEQESRHSQCQFRDF